MIPFRLLLITDRNRFKSIDEMLTVIEQSLQGGVDAVLLREKKLDSAKLLSLASKLRLLTSNYQAQLIIHTQADIAQAVGANGVHVDSVSLRDISKIKSWLRYDMVVSASCHSIDELKQSEKNGADFALLSPVFPTACHPETPALGTNIFASHAQQVQIPVIALGGINATTAREIHGFGIAAMGFILDAQDPKAAAMSLLED